MSNTTNQKTYKVVTHDNSAKPSELDTKFIQENFNKYYGTSVGNQIADFLVLFNKPRTALSILDLTFNSGTATVYSVPLAADPVILAAQQFISGAIVNPAAPDLSLIPIFVQTGSSPLPTELDSHLSILFNSDSNLKAKSFLEADTYGDFASRVMVPLDDLDSFTNLLDQQSAKITELKSMSQFSTGIAKEYLDQAQSNLGICNSHWGDEKTIIAAIRDLLTTAKVDRYDSVPEVLEIARKALVLSRYIGVCSGDPNPLNNLDITSDLLNFALDADLIKEYFHQLESSKYATVTGVSDSEFLLDYCQNYYRNLQGELIVAVSDLVALEAARLALFTPTVILYNKILERNSKIDDWNVSNDPVLGTQIDALTTEINNLITSINAPTSTEAPVTTTPAAPTTPISVTNPPVKTPSTDISTLHTAVSGKLSDIATKDSQIAAKNVIIADKTKRNDKFRAVVAIGAIRKTINDNLLPNETQNLRFKAIFPSYTTEVAIVSDVNSKINGYSSSILPYENFINVEITGKIQETTSLSLNDVKVLLLYIMIITQRYTKGAGDIVSLALIYDNARVAFLLKEGVFLKRTTETSVEMESTIYRMITGNPASDLLRPYFSNTLFTDIDYTKFNYIPITNNCEVEVNKDVRLTFPFGGTVTVKNTSSASIRVTLMPHTGNAFTYEHAKPMILPAGEKKKYVI